MVRRVVLVAGMLSAVVVPGYAGEGVSATELRAGLAWQIALERVGFSPGVIDGKPGRKTELATREFQRVRGLPATGRIDAATAAALGIDASAALATYVVHSGDLAQVGPAPKKWIEKSRLPRSGYESAVAAVAEKFHCTQGLLSRLNPTIVMSQLKAGDVLTVPSTATDAVIAQGSSVQVQLGEKVIRVLNRQQHLVALFHCSIAKDKDRLPVGSATVSVIRENPDYTFDPKMWPEVKDVDRKLLIPPGPRNPVGLCWVGLSLPGYGMHGTPNPEMIGKTGSHGCFRLANWDAIRLGKMLRVGVPVECVGHDLVASAGR
jgi:lipoprotein-anchoring transpeptidase ErfK/SrfK